MLCAEDLPSEEQKEDIETQIQKFNRKVITAFMEILVGREDLYAHEEWKQTDGVISKRFQIHLQKI